MSRIARFAALALMLAGPALLAQSPEETPAPRHAAPRIVNPASPAMRLMLATPEERQRYLEKLPPERRERIQRQLDWFDSLPPQQRQIQIRRAERFSALSPEQRAAVREQFAAFNALPPERRQFLRRALIMLQTLPPRQRVNRMNALAFRARFSESERKILENLTEYLLVP